MSKWKYGVLLLASSIIVGCAETPEPLPQPLIELTKPPVPWPAPVKPTLIPSFKFESVNGSVWATMSLKDYLNFSAGQLQKERFVKDLMAMVCYYQYDETRCSKLNAK